MILGDFVFESKRGRRDGKRGEERDGKEKGIRTRKKRERRKEKRAGGIDQRGRSRN